MLFPAWIGFGAHPAWAGENGVNIYDRNYEYQMKVEGNRVLGQGLPDQIPRRG
jgi:hypothetical protein